MIVIFEAKATEAQIQSVQQKIKDAGLLVHRSDGVEHTILGVVGDRNRLDIESFSLMPGVRDVVLVSTPYKLASHEFHPEDTVVRVADKVLEAAKSGALRHFFLIGGCDGARSGRSWMTTVPSLSLIAAR